MDSPLINRLDLTCLGIKVQNVVVGSLIKALWLLLHFKVK